MKKDNENRDPIYRPTLLLQFVRSLTEQRDDDVDKDLRVILTSPLGDYCCADAGIQIFTGSSLHLERAQLAEPYRSDSEAKRVQLPLSPP